MMEEMDENESVTTSSEEESDTELSYQEDSSAQSGTVHGEEDQEDSNKSQPETQEDEDMESVDHSEEEDEDTDDDLSHLKQICKRYAQRENKTKLDTCVERSLNELLAREGAVAVGPPQFSATAGKSYDRAIKKSVLPRSRFVSGDLQVGELEPVDPKPKNKITRFRQNLNNEVLLAQQTVTDRAAKDATSLHAFSSSGPISDKQREKMRKKAKKGGKLKGTAVQQSIEALIEAHKTSTAKKKVTLDLRNKHSDEVDEYDVMSYEGTHRSQQNILDKIGESENEVQDLRQRTKLMYTRQIRPLIKRHATNMIDMASEHRLVSNIDLLFDRVESNLRKDIRSLLKHKFHDYTSPNSAWTNPITLVRNCVLFEKTSESLGPKKARQTLHGLGMSGESTVKKLFRSQDQKKVSHSKHGKRMASAQKEILKEAKQIFSKHQEPIPEHSLNYSCQRTRYSQSEISGSLQKPRATNKEFVSAKAWRKHISASVVARAAVHLLERIRTRRKEGFSTLADANIDLVDASNRSAEAGTGDTPKDENAKCDPQANGDQCGKLEMDFKILPGAGALDMGVVSARLSLKDYRTAPHYVNVSKMMDEVNEGSEKTADVLKKLGPVGLLLPLPHVVEGTHWYLRMNETDKAKTTKWAMDAGIVSADTLSFALESHESGYGVGECLTEQPDKVDQQNSIISPFLRDRMRESQREEDSRSNSILVTKLAHTETRKLSPPSMKEIQQCLFGNSTKKDPSHNAIRLLQVTRRLAASGVHISHDNFPHRWNKTFNKQKSLSLPSLSAKRRSSMSFQDTGSATEETGRQTDREHQLRKLRAASNKVIAKEKLPRAENTISQIKYYCGMNTDLSRKFYGTLVELDTVEDMEHFLRIFLYTAIGFYHLQQLRITLQDLQKAYREYSILEEEIEREGEETENTVREFMYRIAETGILIQPIPFSTWNYMIQQKLGVSSEMLNKQSLRSITADGTFDESYGTTGLKFRLRIHRKADIVDRISPLEQITEALKKDVGRYDKQLVKQFNVSLLQSVVSNNPKNPH